MASRRALSRHLAHYLNDDAPDAPAEGLRLRRRHSAPEALAWSDSRKHFRCLCAQTDGSPPERAASKELPPNAEAADRVVWLSHGFRTFWTPFLVGILHDHFDDKDNAFRVEQLRLVLVSFATLAGVVGIFVIQALQGVMLPMLLAAGAGVLLEPLVFFLVDPVVRFCTPRRHRPGVSAVLTARGLSVVMTTPDRHAGGACSEFTKIQFIGRWLVVRFWCVSVVSLVLLGLLGCCCSLGLWVVRSVEGANWKRYMNGSRMAFITDNLKSQGVTDSSTFVDLILREMFQVISADIMESLMGAVRSVLLLVLFLGFWLVDCAYHRRDGTEPWLRRQEKLIFRSPSQSRRRNFVEVATSLVAKIRYQMRAWIVAKFYLSVFKAILIGTMFFALRVELSVLWTILTFLFNFMPLGSAISTLAPLPFVFLDPTKNLLIVAICVLWPLLVHNLVGNIVEPRLFANCLHLHPITVLLALAFWTATWGVLGALVCVPLTAILRVIFVEFQSHPWVPNVLALMEGRRVVT